MIAVYLLNIYISVVGDKAICHLGTVMCMVMIELRNFIIMILDVIGLLFMLLVFVNNIFSLVITYNICLTMN